MTHSESQNPVQRNQLWRITLTANGPAGRSSPRAGLRAPDAASADLVRRLSARRQHRRGQPAVGRRARGGARVPPAQSTQPGAHPAGGDLGPFTARAAAQL